MWIVICKACPACTRLQTQQWRAVMWWEWKNDPSSVFVIQCQTNFEHNPAPWTSQTSLVCLQKRPPELLVSFWRQTERNETLVLVYKRCLSVIYTRDIGNLCAPLFFFKMANFFPITFLKNIIFAAFARLKKKTKDSHTLSTSLTF